MKLKNIKAVMLKSVPFVRTALVIVAIAALLITCIVVGLCIYDAINADNDCHCHCHGKCICTNENKSDINQSNDIVNQSNEVNQSTEQPMLENITQTPTPEPTVVQQPLGFVPTSKNNVLPTNTVEPTPVPTNVTPTLKSDDVNVQNTEPSFNPGYEQGQIPNVVDSEFGPGYEKGVNIPSDIENMPIQDFRS